jgi:hypothetical protein
MDNSERYCACDIIALTILPMVNSGGDNYFKVSEG